MSIFRSPAKAGQNKKDSEAKWPALQRRSVLRWGLGAGTVLILSLLLSLHLFPNRVSLQVGDVSLEEIRAHKTVRRYVDTVETDRLRQEAAAQVGNQYRDVPNAAADAAASVSDAFSTLQRARMDASLPTTSQKMKFVQHNLRPDLNESALLSFLQLDNHEFGQVEAYSERLVKAIMAQEIRDDNDDVEKARAEFHRRMNNFLANVVLARAATELADDYIKPNRIFDFDLTERKRAEKSAEVPTQYRQIFIGEVVVARGDRVTLRHIDKLTALGLRNPQTDYLTVLCVTALVASALGVAVFYISRYHRRVSESTKLMFLLALVVVFSVLGLKLGAAMLGINLSGLQFGYFAMSWIATAGMLTTILLHPQIAIMVVALLAAMTGVTLNHELRWVLGSLLSSLVAIYAVSDIRHRSDLLRAAGAVCASNLVIVWLIGRISGDEFPEMLVGSIWALAGGLGSIMLFDFGTRAFEKPFGITTHNRLVELSDTNNPMLKRLLMEAPGTYSHSIFTGNIAATAADAIGADSLLVRVGSYYHDIGKIKRAHFFVENQHVENVHDRLTPTLSALVIRSHIADGLELASEYRLPPRICELMSQHHGTGLVRYFYTQAASGPEGGSNALEQQFRYEGSKPQSKEAALLMLADSVEAASRALAKPSPGQIEDMVDGVIHEKLTDGQLDESELTFKDISRLRDSFVRTLLSMMHARIEYPELPSAEAKKFGGNGSSGKEPPAGAGGQDKADRGRQEVAAG